MIINEMLNKIFLRTVMYCLKVLVIVREETRSTGTMLQSSRHVVALAITVLVHLAAHFS